jgi:hypothetical protein
MLPSKKCNVVSLFALIPICKYIQLRDEVSMHAKLFPMQLRTMHHKFDSEGKYSLQQSMPETFLYGRQTLDHVACTY